MRKVVLSKSAALKLDELLSYLETEWSMKTKIEFVVKLDKAIHRLTKFPQSGEKSKIKVGLHRCIVTKQTSILYRFDDKNIYIVALFDNRQNPEGREIEKVKK